MEERRLHKWLKYQQNLKSKIKNVFESHKELENLTVSSDDIMFEDSSKFFLCRNAKVTRQEFYE